MRHGGEEHQSSNEWACSDPVILASSASIIGTSSHEVLASTMIL